MPSRMIDGTEMHFAEAGEGPPLVLVHGTLLDQRYWEPQMAAFAARYHVYALSLRHYWPEAWDGVGDDFTIAQHAEDVAAFMASLGGKARLIGHSRGGHISFRVAGAHPELIEELVLAEPGGELDESLGGKPPSGAQAAGFARAAAEIAAGRIDAGLRMVAEQTGGVGAFDRRSARRNAIARDNARTLLGQVHENRLPFSRASAEAVTARTLLVNGDQTQQNFITNCEALVEAMPDARRVVIPNAKHSMSDDNPEAFNKAVLEFFSA
jgi:pimeloyl-ACP methyl ester carboxylesterase